MKALFIFNQNSELAFERNDINSKIQDIIGFMTPDAPIDTSKLLFLGQKHDKTSCEFESARKYKAISNVRLFIYTFCYLLAEKAGEKWKFP